MIEIKVIIQTPDLSDAIKQLALAMTERNIRTEIPATPGTAGIAIPAPQTESVSFMPVPQHQPEPQPQPQPQPQPEPEAKPAPVEPPKPIDLSAICKAGAGLIDQGKKNDVMAALKKFGVQAVTQLDPTQYSAFAMELRALGAAV